MLVFHIQSPTVMVRIDFTVYGFKRIELKHYFSNALWVVCVLEHNNRRTKLAYLKEVITYTYINEYTHLIKHISYCIATQFRDTILIAEMAPKLSTCRGLCCSNVSSKFYSTGLLV